MENFWNKLSQVLTGEVKGAMHTLILLLGKSLNLMAVTPQREK
jgi:hypothetical protein